ncbi:hypothetical protein N9L75_03730 [Porticoccaceae bacterium]|nr:hypothetical protein [Porticoccaceae bacterium]MDA8651666.1 hypothetical protein [Porticoccaceae bacterium]MDB2665135.1 hypothetical protein [Porticoccaceae bacterium]
MTTKTDGREWVDSVKEELSQGLSNDELKQWDSDFKVKVEAVKDFSVLYHSFMLGLLEVALPHDKYGVVQPVIDLHKDYKNVTSEDWEAVSDAAGVGVKAADAGVDAATFEVELTSEVWDAAVAKAAARVAAPEAWDAVAARAKTAAEAAAKVARNKAIAKAKAAYHAAVAGFYAAVTAFYAAGACYAACDADSDADAARAAWAAARATAWADAEASGSDEAEQKIRDVFLNADGG